ncbi:MAG: glycosyltransferase family 39 protein [Eubacteriales bacterium]|nr:glycosyltransferase family 39 protein [Eubacteriales bacterium]
MKKKALLFALIILAVLAGVWFIARDTGPKAETGVELLKNGGFEDITGEGLPLHWLPDAYVRLQGVTEFEVTDGPGGNAVQIISHEPNDARFCQTVDVLPNTTYRLTGRVKAQAEGGLGANLSIEDVYVFSESLYDTGDKWQEIVFYGKTGSNQNELTVFARLGGYSGESSGTAAFDDLSLMAVAETPEDAFVSSWEKPNRAPVPATSAAASPAAPWLLALIALGAVMLYWFAKMAEREKVALPQKDKPGLTRGLAIILLVAGLTRLVMAVLVTGFPVDIACFTGWADQMARVGPGNFYISDIFSDYPPGYMLVLWPLGLMGRLFGTGATAMMVKLPAILCDLAIITLIYSVSRKRVGDKAALWLSMLYAFNPLPYLAAGAWGQVDSVPSLLLASVVLLIMDKKWRYALPVYVVSVLMKPQSLMVGPLGLVALLAHLISSRDRGRFKDLAMGVGLSLAAAAVMVLPFFNEQTGFKWLIDLYGGTMSYYDYATVNATNLYFLFGKNWIKISEFAPFWLRLTSALTIILPAAAAWGRSGKRQDKGWLLGAACLLPALAVLFPVSLAIMGILLMVSVFLLVAWRYLAANDVSNLALLAGVMLTGFSILGTMMHERYLMMAVVLFILAYALRRDRRLLWLIIAATALCFSNSGVVLDRGIRIGGPSGNLMAPELGLASDSAWLEMALSAFSIPVAAYALYLGIILTGPGAAPQLVSPAKFAVPEERMPEKALLERAKPPIRLDKKDRLFILVVTALYAVLAFVNLGATTAPQNAWVSGSEVSQATLDLGETRDFEILYYGGVHQRVSDFIIETSADNETWAEYPASMKEGDCFTWLYHKPGRDTETGMQFDGAPIRHKGRFVRITAPTIGLTLMEVMVRDADSGETLPVKALEPESAALTDEQDTLRGEPSWFNSMYFDEIYHGRTAYEMLNAIRGQEPSTVYETTHPQLGKLLMTFSLMVFGMTPFGWRFAGALAGVLMLPGMYVIGRQLTRRRGGGAIAILLMAFDFMHFTQTRIATIDSFVTLFIIYAYLFMFKYMQLDVFSMPVIKTIRPLALSGLMMGFAIASKWTGAYAGIGLAVLFFWAQARWARQGRALKRLALAERDKIGWDAAAVSEALEYRRRFLITCLWCLLFFVLIPLVIYAASFIPMFIRTPGGVSLKKVADANVNMYAYHSEPGRGADHFFHTPWYEWPLDARPMWYYAGGVVNGTASTIMAFGNPLIWWGGLAAMIGLTVLALMGLMGRFTGSRRPWFSRADIRPAMLVIAFLAQYLPWVMVPRGTYIYHYFPAVPFIILALVLWQDAFALRKPRRARAAAIVFVALAAVLFIAFFPYLSGVRVSTNWLDALKWFPGWLYY